MANGAPKLIVLSEQHRGKSFELTEDVHSCGRVESADIYIKDPTISTHHCDFVRTENSYLLRDHNSTNGTRVNNVPITEQELQNSDILQLGGVEILFDCDDKTVTTVLRTQTGINLQGDQVGLSTVKKMNNVSPYGTQNQRGGKSHKVMVLIVIVFTLFALGLIGYLISLLLKQG